MSTSKEILKYLYGLERGGIKPGLERIERLVEALGNPQLAYPCVHVGGTNGKGSTAAMTASILMKAGYRVGLYTSPHLVRFSERIRINNREISNAALVKIATRVRKAARSVPASTGSVSFFEFTTAMAFEYFRQERVDIAVIEVGMGGRWDATNVVRPLVSVITTVDIDHTAYLGKSLAKIAVEKAGIIKKGVPVVCGESKAQAVGIIAKAANAAGAPLYRLGTEFDMTDGAAGLSYRGINGRIDRLKLGLVGGHQKRNAACALAAVELLKEAGWRIPLKAIRDGLRGVSWPGRVEVLGCRPLVIIDSAHNPAGAATLSASLALFRYKKLFLVLGIMADKDIDGIMSALAPLAHTVIVCVPVCDRAASLDVMRDRAASYGKEVITAASVTAACKAALEAASAADAVCVTGSIFTVGEARSYLLRVCGR
ncbi:MAG: bifunctional folylpolyglutamate synthase/dihydrofolate synthase [Deltaproteobacteria bacterium]|nr:bifunctional folylpolyglutamate synthase/dihydrofolate synthase [Deltaproteobacteria bacterium]